MMKMTYKTSAEDSAYGWEHQSLPIGNGYMGANIFGIVDRERIQITENSLVNTYTTGGLNNFAEIYIQFPHQEAENYERGLSLDNATAYVEYSCGDVTYRREYFASYPDKVLVMKLKASQKGALTFTVAPEIPFIKDYAVKEGYGGGKTGQVSVDQNTITLKGEMLYYNTLFEGQIKILSTDGEIVSGEKSVSVERASEAVIIFGLGTNYELSPEVFLEKDRKKKLKRIDPHNKVCNIIAQASKSWDELLVRHLEDYQSLFHRVSLVINDNEAPDIPTDEMLALYKKEHIPYLEALYFQYGRYLLISSSRKGCLPANLQGIWNCHDASPWGSGYWHNINVQMNYWPAFNTNLLEMFESYVDFFHAFLPKAREFADEYINKHNPENLSEAGRNGWTIGTASYPYTISKPGGHSGPGTGGLTSQLFWEYYDFTRDHEILENITYPALEGMAEFLTKTVKKYDDLYLTSFSASPEQMNNGKYVGGGSYYQTVGCAFDQQMIEQNGRNLLTAAEKLGKTTEESPVLEEQTRQIAFYDPVQVGWSGQVKEYREEQFYGEIGEYCHRHISHLMALYPGNLISHETDAWFDAAKVALNERGDQSTGWALAHRLNARARTGEGNRCHVLLQELLQNRTMNNLWDEHPPFQIDGNFGATAGIAEMLIQSHEGYIRILPALPDKWESGSYCGLTARGAFEVSVEWKGHFATKLEVLSKNGEVLQLCYPGIADAVLTEGGNSFEVISEDRISLPTEAGKIYKFCLAEETVILKKPENLEVNSNILSWTGDGQVKYNIYRAVNSQAKYERIAEAMEGLEYTDCIDFARYETITYKVTACKDGRESEGTFKTINHATQLQIDRYRNQLHGKIPY